MDDFKINRDAMLLEYHYKIKEYGLRKLNKNNFNQVIKEIETEVSYRPGNFGYEKCLAHFMSCI